MRFKAGCSALLLAAIVMVCASVLFWNARNAYYLRYPIERAEIAIRKADRSVLRLEYYGGDDEQNAKGYLTFVDGLGEVRKKMEGSHDWVHWHRTSVYLMGDERIAVLGPGYDDYVVDPKRRTIADLRQGTASDDWAYLGAFDFADEYKGLKFIPASEEQRECTPTLGELHPWATRPQGRRVRC